MAKLNVEPNSGALALAAARRVAELVTAAITRTGTARLCLTGGQTPREMYHLLGTRAHDGVTAIDWSRVDLFWGDERHVPPDHPDSNYGMAKAALLEPASVPPERVHRIHAELPDAADAARDYDRIVRRFARETRTFDVMLLGLGADAHIASLFPHNPLLAGLAGVRDVVRLENDDRATHASSPRVDAVWAAHLDAWRITLTPPALLDSDAILVITSGPGKSGAVRAALEERERIAEWPAQLLRAADDRVEWWLDRDAAAAIKRGSGVIC